MRQDRVGCSKKARGGLRPLKQLPPKPTPQSPAWAWLPTWEEGGEVWCAVARDIGEGSPRRGGGGRGGGRQPTVRCLYERTVQTTC